MGAAKTWNEELEKELTFECLGEPERPITEELCSNAGAKYAAVFSKAEDMVKAALEVKKLNRDAFCKLPFCVTIEAEAFGSSIRFSSNEVPVVTNAIVESVEDVEALRVPEVGEGRTGVYVDAIREVSKLINDRPVLAGAIGPFSLAGRLNDVSEIMVNCYDDPDLVHALMAKVTPFIISYINAFKAAGADGVLLAEPLTGLMSKDMATEFSEPYVRQIAEAVQDDSFVVIYHNCGNNAYGMIDSILRTGCSAFHFGNAVNMLDILHSVPSDVVVMGNVDPASQFCNGKRKITYGEIRLADSFQMVFQFFLVHGRDGRNQKTASREVLH